MKINSLFTTIFCFSRIQLLLSSKCSNKCSRCQFVTETVRVHLSQDTKEKKISLILFLAPIKSGRTILSWVSPSTKEGEGKGKLGQIILIGVSSFGVWIINKCFDENNCDIKQQCKVIVCYLENTLIKHPQYLQLMKYRKKGVSPNTKISKYEFKNIQNKRPIKRTNLQIDFYLAFSKSSREKEAFQ